MKSSEAYYLTEVLGIQQIPAPKPLVDAQVPASKPSVVVPNLAAGLCVCTPFQPSESEQGMIEKMLAAAQIQNATFFYLNEISWSDIEKVCKTSGVGYGLAFGAIVPTEMKELSVQWAELPSVSRFLDETNPTQLRKIKSSAWEALKKIRSGMTKLNAMVVAVLLAVSVVFQFPAQAQAQAPTPTPTPVPPPAQIPESKPCVMEVTIDGAIGPATLDFIQRAEKRVRQNQCGSMLLLINTPGGNLQTTRLIVEGILNSDFPVLCLIYPSGAHAGSAGAIIMQACHVSGAMEATNIGAATPISGGGEKLPDDLRKKMINDTRSWVEGLAKLRSRSEQFARDIVEEAKAVTAREALKINAIDYVAESKADFLRFAEGRTVKLNANREAKVTIGEVHVLQQDLRYKVMDLLMNPQVAYIMFMGSLALLYFELTHPGMIAPGVIGGVGLLISLISMHMLDVTWGAVLLILAGIGLMLAEAFVAGFGILGVGGIVSFFVGSLFLFDPEQSGFALPISTIIPTSVLAGLIMIGIAYLAFTSHKRKTHAGTDDMIGREARVSEVQPDDPTFGLVEIEGEIWKVASKIPLSVGDRVKIESRQGLTLMVTKNKENQT